MGASVFVALAVAAGSAGQTISQAEVDQQNEAYKHWWGEDLVWKFDELPTKGSVRRKRIPYSGYIYPDTGGGTINALSKYDRAFGTRGRASAYERWDTTAFTESRVVRGGGLFGFGSYTVQSTPHWHGHCNGWTAAAIRHAEPKRTVVRNGVRFTPADIKALLAEIYIYNENENLAGVDFRMNAAMLHVVLANWLGRHTHPVGMEADPGREKWNYPIYAYNTSHAKRGNRVEVKMNIAYSNNSRGEFQQSPRIKRIKYFHYSLSLNSHGEIIGGGFYGDSSRIDMLWVPLQPKRGGTAGNERGNPHVNVNEVLAIWRASVDEEDRKDWLIVDPPRAERTLLVANGYADIFEPAVALAGSGSESDATAAVTLTDGGVETVADSAAESPESTEDDSSSDTPAGDAPAATETASTEATSDDGEPAEAATSEDEPATESEEDEAPANTDDDSPAATEDDTPAASDDEPTATDDDPPADADDETATSEDDAPASDAPADSPTADDSDD